MVMFWGVTPMQWLSGIVAAFAENRGAEVYEYMMFFVAGMRMVGCLAFRFLPKSPLLAAQEVGAS